MRMREMRFQSKRFAFSFHVFLHFFNQTISQISLSQYYHEIKPKNRLGSLGFNLEITFPNFQAFAILYQWFVAAKALAKHMKPEPVKVNELELLYYLCFSIWFITCRWKHFNNFRIQLWVETSPACLEGHYGITITKDVNDSCGRINKRIAKSENVPTILIGVIKSLGKFSVCPSIFQFDQNFEKRNYK